MQTTIVNLNDLAPSNHNYRKLLKIVDFDIVATAELSSLKNNKEGRRGGYSVLQLFKVLVLQFMENVFISGQKRNITDKIKKELKKRSIIEPVIGHIKNDGHTKRNYSKGKETKSMPY